MINVGIIGLGFIGLLHLEALKRLPGIDVIAISDVNREKIIKLAKEYKILEIYTDWRDLLSSRNIDVVHNCTPNFLHYDVNKKTLESGLSIFSEKPLAMNILESEELLTLAKKTSLSTGINYCYRYYPTVQWMRQLISEGYIGEIHSVDGYYKQDWLMFAEDYNWRVESRFGGQSRVLADIGQHWCDLLEFITELKIKRVFADYTTVIKKRKKTRGSVETFSKTERGYEEIEVDTEDRAAILLKLTGGVRGNFLVSQIDAGHKNDLVIEISGSLKSIRWRQEEPDYLWVGERGGRNHVIYKDPEGMPESIKSFANYPAGHPEGYADIIKNTLANFYSVSKNYQLKYPDFFDGHRCMKIIDAIFKSGQMEIWVDV